MALFEWNLVMQLVRISATRSFGSSGGAWTPAYGWRLMWSTFLHRRVGRSSSRLPTTPSAFALWGYDPQLHGFRFRQRWANSLISRLWEHIDAYYHPAVAQPAGLHTTDEITAHPLRAPEIILQGPWDNKVDIWAFGCLVHSRIPPCICTYFYPLTVPINLQIFELTIGRALFQYIPYLEYKLDEPTGHLWHMLCFTRKRMMREQVNSSKLGARVCSPLFCLSFLFFWLHKLFYTYAIKPRWPKGTSADI